VRPKAQRTRNEIWKPIFRSKTFEKEHDDLTFDQYRLKESKLKSLGVQVSKIRQELRDKALKIDT
jgi:hypothetical protein